MLPPLLLLGGEGLVLAWRGTSNVRLLVLIFPVGVEEEMEWRRGELTIGDREAWSLALGSGEGCGARRREAMVSLFALR